MPAGNPVRNPPSTETTHLTLPPSSKATHIRNKDGTKLITVPSRKASNPESTLTGNPIAPLAPPAQPPLPPASMGDSYVSAANNGGKKKKKKKGKQTNQQQQQNQQQHLAHEHGHPMHQIDFHDYNSNHSNVHTEPYQRDIKASLDDYHEEYPELIDPELEEDEYYSDQAFDEDEDDDSYTSPQHPQNQPTAQAAGKKKNKKKKKKGVNRETFSIGGASPSGGQNGAVGNGRRGGKDRIWNTSTNEERERIKEFWLSLGESERRSLVKVEKEAVLKKMKEQQKHSCSCSVCGRKRTAIEEELEVLYDAYYEELEQYANQQQTSKYSDDEFEDEDDEEEDDDELDEPLPENDHRPDFFSFGNSLTVQGGILTVADDLLKNDGKKFIEMMEQLAERRMQREEEANAAANGHQPLSMSMGQAHTVHTHTPQQEYDDDEEYEEDDEDEEEYDDDEEDEADTMTEEQRMEEGRRMFQIFAARMFEQRVLTAYRERVAQERQRKLLEELDEEDRLREEREQKKAKEKDKKKEKKRLQKLAKEEEKLRKDAERAAEEAQRKALEEKRNEELRKKREEQRLKREAEKKAAEEERHRREEEKRRRQQEDREREAERERKRKENLEREKKKKEEAARKAREEKEAREKEAREKREREDRERKEREAKLKKEVAEKERLRKEEEVKAKAEAAAAAAAAIAAAAAKRPPPVSLPISIPQPQHPSSAYASPHLSVATPAIPKQPIGSSPARPRNPSQQGSIQGSVASSPKTPHTLPRIGANNASPNTPILQHNIPGPIFPPNKTFQFPPQMPPTSPIPNFIAPPPGVTSPESAYGGLPPMGINGLSPIQPPFMPGFPQRPLGNLPPMYPPGQIPLGAHPHFRPFGMGPNGMMQVPGPAGARSIPPQGRGLYMDNMAPGLPQSQLPPGMPIMPNGSPFMNRVEPAPLATHNRAPSGSFEPIQRPTPIQRPSSVAPPKNSDDHQNSIDELSKVMGSRALLEDDDEAAVENIAPSRRSSAAMFGTRVGGFPGTPGLFPDHLGSVKDSFASWGNPMPLGTMSNSLPNTWGNGAGWSDTDPSRSSTNRRRVGRLDQIRSLACQVCRELAGPNNSFVEIGLLEKAMEQVAPQELAIQSTELVTVLDVEGDPQNGGGNFKFSQGSNGRTSIQYEPDEPGLEVNLHHPAPGAPGEIGSPVVNSAVPLRVPMGLTGMPTTPSAFC